MSFTQGPLHRGCYTRVVTQELFYSQHAPRWWYLATTWPQYGRPFGNASALQEPWTSPTHSVSFPCHAMRPCSDSIQMEKTTAGFSGIMGPEDSYRKHWAHTEVYDLKFSVEVVLGFVLHHADAVDPRDFHAGAGELPLASFGPSGVHWHPLTWSQLKQTFSQMFCGMFVVSIRSATKRFHLLRETKGGAFVSIRRFMTSRSLHAEVTWSWSVLNFSGPFKSCPDVPWCHHMSRAQGLEEASFFGLCIFFEDLLGWWR